MTSDNSPQAQRALVESGHEIANHISEHRVPKEPALEEDHLAKTVAALERIAGQRPIGTRSSYSAKLLRQYLLPDWTYRSAFLERMPRQTRHLHAHAVNRSVCGEKERLHVRSAKSEIGRHLGRLDRADMGPVRRINPGAAGAGAIDVALHIDLHPVRHAN